MTNLLSFTADIRRIIRTSCVGFAMSAVAAALSLSGCSRHDDSVQHKTDDLPVIVKGDELWSMYGYDTQMLFEDKFESMPSTVVDGYFSVRHHDGYTLYAASDNPQPVTGMTGLYSIGYCCDGLVPASRPGGRIEVMSPGGDRRFTLSPYLNMEIVSCDLAYSSGMLKVKTEQGKYGYYDTKGNLAIKPVYDQAETFEEGVAMTCVFGTEGLKNAVYRVINPAGQTVVTLPDGFRPAATRFTGGRMPVRRPGNRLGYIDLKGNVTVCPDEVKAVGRNQSDKYVYYTSDGDCGVMDMDGDVIIQPHYKSIDFLPSEMYLAQEEPGIFVLLDKFGDVKLKEKKFATMRYFERFGLICTNNDGTRFINRNGIPNSDKVFRRVGLQPSAAGFVRSDYFNYTAAADAIVDALTPSGIGRYRLGAKISRYITSVEEFVADDMEFEINDIFRSGFGFSVSVKGIADRCIIDKAQGDSNVALDRDATLDAILISVVSERPWWDEEQTRLRPELNRNGFSEVAIRKDGSLVYTLYRSPKSEIVTVTGYSRNKVDIYLFNGQGGSRWLNSLPT